MWEKVIFVGKSGTSRAPMAAGILQEYTLKHPVQIEARGMVVLFPEPINQKIAAVLISNGINMDDFRSVQLVAEDVDDHTLVLILEEKDRSPILEILGEERAEQVEVLTEVVGEELEIIDPYGGTLQTYGLCFETMSKTIKKLAAWLNETNVEEEIHE